MFKVNLFLGFPVDDLYVKALENVNPMVVAQFINEEEGYLSDIMHSNMRFLGKNVGTVVVLPKLELLEANIYSLLKKLVPDFPYQEAPLYLFPLENKLYEKF